MEMPAMHEKVITTEPDICRYVPNDPASAMKKPSIGAVLALLARAYSAHASAQTAVSVDNAERFHKKTTEASFMAENQAAMSKMMKDMMVKPSGNVDADFTAMMIPHHQGAVAMAKAELQYGHNGKLRRIARNIIAGQTQQIGAMKAALGQPLSQAASSATQSVTPLKKVAGSSATGR
jgi:uncharacterized protein (DUF305 family)